MNDRLYNAPQRLLLINKTPHRSNGKKKASQLFLIRFCRYWQYLQDNITLKAAVHWGKKFVLETHCDLLEDQLFRHLYRI